jgi:hypothetical protein
MRKLRQHQRVQLRMRRERVSGFKGLFCKPLEKHLVLTHPDLKRVSGFAVANPDIKFERETR